MKSKSGDMWDLLAYERLGSERYLPHLLKENPDLMTTYKFRAGVEIKLPEIEKPLRKVPPWKKS